MIRDQERYRILTRRAVLLAGGKLALLTTLAARMYYLQVIEGDRYRTLAEDNRINLRLLAPPRGVILDRYGVEIASNRQNYQLVVVPERSPDVDQTLARVARVIALDDHDRKRVRQEIRRKRGFVPVTVRDDLDWREVAKIEVNTPDLPGVLIEVGQTRLYPFGAAAAHVVGYVGAVSERELTGDPLLELPSARIGKNGIEKVFDKRLRGRGGRAEVEVNATGRVIRELSRKEGRPGDRIRLTLDMGLQEFAHERIGEESAAVTVMDVNNGEVLALASAPAFDPNAFNMGVSRDYWRELTGNDRAPLTNKTIAGQYAPGSTFKMMVALAALEAGLVGPDHRVFCRGWTQLGNARFHCWKKHGHGWLDMVGGLQQSCDVYFYDLARRVGVNRIAAMAEKFGLGAPVGLGLPGEKPGLVPTREWKLAVMGEKWQGGETLVAGIGQGFVLATPLQLAVMTARIANGGSLVKPRLIAAPAAVPGPDGPAPPAPPPGLGVSSDALDVVRRGMYAVSNTPRGTAWRARIREEKWRIAGKTGTSQVRRITLGERERGVVKNEKRPWKERDHALFVGYAPAHDPRYAVSVVVEHGGGGSKAAAPIARDVMREALLRAERAAQVPGQSAAADGNDGDGRRADIAAGRDRARH
ncbi:MAG: penicillin-binding protein 2 [Alphaproteobacteria bacterium]|nr:penicillin-binding protein 2 [Alphaproteobacteria bacterium]